MHLDIITLYWLSVVCQVVELRSYLLFNVSSLISLTRADLKIVFDECHKAKNLIPSGSAKPTKTGYTVLELQKRLPNARFVLSKHIFKDFII